MSEEPLPQDEVSRKASTTPLILAVIILVVVLIVFGLVWGKGFVEGTNTPGPAQGDEYSFIGTWETDDSSLQMRIEFMPDGAYELVNLQGYTVVGEWELAEKGLAEVPVSWREYEGVWYFEQIAKDELHLEVTELEIDRIFYRTQ